MAQEKMSCRSQKSILQVLEPHFLTKSCNYVAHRNIDTFLKKVTKYCHSLMSIHRHEKFEMNTIFLRKTLISKNVADVLTVFSSCCLNNF